MGGTYDYSRQALPTLRESHLNETIGLGSGASSYGTRHFCHFFLGLIDVAVPVTDATAPIDWNCDDDTTDTDISVDINNEGGSGQDLKGYEDWSHLKLKGGAIGLAGVIPNLPMETEEEYLTQELAKHILPVGSIYNFNGFYPPVDNPGPTNVFNTVKAGSAIPVKFSLGGDKGLNIFVQGYPKAVPTTCPGGSTSTDPIEDTVTSGSSSLQYDPVTQQYTHVWKTQKGWATKCYQLVLRLNDGSDHVANFKFTR